jgi:exodeoxyribonuclease-3
LIVGDFNIAPLECDVWNHKALLDVVSHTPIEVETLGRLQAAHDWVDLGRKFIPAPDRCYTWWSYRAQDWAASDRGRRLDHMWCSPSLAPQVTAHRVLEPCRSWERPSDHVPLILELEV